MVAARSAETASAAQCWQQQHSGGVGRAAEAVRQQHDNSGQRSGSVSKARAVAALWPRRQRQQQYSCGGQQCGRAAMAVSAW